MNPIDHYVDLVREAAIQVLDVSLRIQRQQDGRGRFHGQRFAVLYRRLEQEFGHLADGLNQAAKVGLAKFFDHRCQGRGVAAESRQCLRAAGTKLVPRLFCA
ncbi:MAG: hypothetical protein V5B30_08495, partial [Candidatus Accumulibacter delftensis]